MTEDADLHLVTFRVGRQLYGVDIMQVHRVLQACQPLPVPGAPDHVMGMIDLHGRLVAVMDLRLLLGLEADPTDTPRRLLVAELGGGSGPSRLAALAVTDVEARLRVARADLLARPDEIGAPAVVGAFHSGDELGLVLDPERLDLGLDRIAQQVEGAG